MKIKSVLILIFTCVIGLFLSGCKKSGCTLYVTSSYGGSGMDGQDLGSGSFTEEFTVYAGDVFYEDAAGHWVRDGENVFEEIIKITEIGSDGAVIILDGESVTIPYNSSKRISSRYIVCDGTNYSYSISFSPAET